MNLEMFLMLLMIVSIMTWLFTEAIKGWLKERKKNYYPNALAGWVAVVLSALVGAGYIIMTQAVLNAQMLVYLIALVLMSWLSAMVGYDKVIQAVAQFRHYEVDK
ncbi:MAG: aminopeptidase [Eubacteriales bacterium]|nr:aminopeptidase [Eubacteriales bacterium]